MARGRTARASRPRPRPPIADVRVTRPDGSVEIWTAARWRREHPRRARRAAAPVTDVPDVPYPLPFGGEE